MRRWQRRGLVALAASAALALGAALRGRRARRHHAAQRLLRPDARALPGVQRGLRRRTGRRKTGEDVTVQQSHGGSGKQARAVIDGLEADVVTLALAYDIDAIAEHGELLPTDWQARLPHNSAPYTSTIVFLVRKGNPKGIKDWDDLVKPGVAGDHAEPEDLGRRALELPRGLGLRAARSRAATRRRRATFVARALSRTCRCSTPARAARPPPSSSAASATCCSPGRTRRFLALEELGAGQVRDRRAVASASWPSRRSRVVDKVVDKHGTRAVAEAYLEFLYTPEAQEIAAQALLPAARSRQVAAKYAGDVSRSSSCSPIDEVFGGWAKAQATHFADGGIFDQIYAPVARERRDGRARALAAARSVLPGFGLTLGFTLLYLGLIVLIPLSALFLQAADARAGRSSGRRVTDAARAGVATG